MRHRAYLWLLPFALILSTVSALYFSAPTTHAVPAGLDPTITWCWTAYPQYNGGTNDSRDDVLESSCILGTASGLNCSGKKDITTTKTHEVVSAADQVTACQKGKEYLAQQQPAVQPQVDQPQPAQTAQPQVKPADTTTPPDTSKSSCAVEKLGWILCPLIETGAKMSDWAFNFLASWFLEVPTGLFDNKNNNPTFTAWEQARNLANIAFIIAFMILVYSQITGGLMSNYGIKRMLPRLIIAAIAVNVSYYICQGMVDLSNLLGYSIKDAFDNWTKTLPQVLGSGSGALSNTTSTGVLGGLSGIAIKALAVVGAVWALLGLLTGAIGGILGIIIFILVLLLLRKAFIVLLIVVSPLAFVAYLLPNTEKYYKQWMSAFMNLLAVFPIIAALLGSGQLASGIILNAGTEDGAAPTSQVPRCATPQSKPTGIDKPLVCNPNSAQVAASHSGTGFKLADLRAQSHGVILAATNNCAAGSVVTDDGTGNPSCGPSVTVGTNRHASLGLGIAAAVMEVVPLAAAVQFLRTFMKNMGGAFAELSGNLEKTSGFAGKGLAAGASSLLNRNTTLAAARYSFEHRKEGRQHRATERIAQGLTSGKGGRGNWLVRTAGGKKNVDINAATGAHAALQQEEQANKQEEALYTNAMNNRKGEEGFTAYAFLKKQYKDELAAAENGAHNVSKLNALENLLATTQGQDGQQVISEAIDDALKVAHDKGHVNHSLQEHARHVTLHGGGMTETNMATYGAFMLASTGETSLGRGMAHYGLQNNQHALRSDGSINNAVRSITSGYGGEDVNTDQAISSKALSQITHLNTSLSLAQASKQITLPGENGTTIQPLGVQNLLNNAGLQSKANAAVEDIVHRRIDTTGEHKNTTTGSGSSSGGSRAA